MLDTRASVNQVKFYPCVGEKADLASLYSYKNNLLPPGGTYFCFKKQY